MAKLSQNSMRQLLVTTSWDDGMTTDLKLVEMLEKYSIRATLYIAKGIANPLRVRDLIEIEKKFEIGAHTLGHIDLVRLPLSEAKYEIEGSKKYIEDLLGQKVPMFSYPFGKHNRAVRQMVKDSGFSAARTAIPRGFDLPADPYQWHVTLLASNGSPLMAAKIIWQSRLIGFHLLLDWESRAKALFDLALKMGGIYHLYGHSYELERAKTWDKLERVLCYISNRENVSYVTNGDIFKNISA